MEELILRGVVAKAGMALAILRLSRRRQCAKEATEQVRSAWNVHRATSSLGNLERRKIAAGFSD
jgi:hypothetical protein